jgi:type IV pilus assembly protein PilW
MNERLSIRHGQPPGSPRQQSGISLVDLMVAMLLSLILIGGLLQLSVSHKTGYQFQQSKTGNQENMRFAFYYLETLIGRAGFITLPQNTENYVFGPLSASSQCAAFQSGQFVADSLEGTGICIRFQRANSTEVDCLGQAIASDDAFITRIYHDSTNRQLMCGAQGAAAQPLVDDIEQVQFSFGLADISNPTDRSIEKYIVTLGSSEWRQVVAVRVSVLTSQPGGLLPAAQSYVFPLDGTTTTTGDLRRVYYSGQKTITLRNAIL